MNVDFEHLKNCIHLKSLIEKKKLFFFSNSERKVTDEVTPTTSNKRNEALHNLKSFRMPIRTYIFKYEYGHVKKG